MCLLPIKLIPGECTSLSLTQSHITAWRQLLRCVQTSAASGHVHGGVVMETQSMQCSLKKVHSHVVYSNSVCSVIV